MAIDFTFNGQTTKNSTIGYKISCRLKPGIGFEGEFYVYLELERESYQKSDFYSTIGPDGPGGAPCNGKLTFLGQHSEEGPKHEFSGIDLKASHLRSRQNQKTRVLEFKYQKEILDTEEDSSPVTLENSWDHKLEDNRLGDDYKLTLNGRTDGLLGLSFRQGRDAQHILRLAWYSNKANSFLKEILEMRRLWLPLSFKLGDHEFNLPQEDVTSVFVDHSFGSFLDEPLPSVSNISNNTGEGRSLAQLEIQDDTGFALLTAEGADPNSSAASFNRVVETVTFVLKGPKYEQMEIE